jgi:hypothetical protein
MLEGVIHLALGLLILSLTCLVLTVLSYTAPGIHHASWSFASGSMVSTGVSLGLTTYVWRSGI